MKNALSSVRYRVAGGGETWDAILDDFVAQSATTLDSAHGLLKLVTLVHKANASGVEFTLEFAAPLERPFFLWRLRAHNLGSHPMQFERIRMLAAGPASTRAIPRKNPSSVRLHAEPGEFSFFSNGWQSWSYTGALSSRERYPQTRLGPVTSSRSHTHGTPRPFRRGHFVSHMFGVLADRTHRRGLLTGFLSQQRQFGYIEAFAHSPDPSIDLCANCDGVLIEPDDSIETDWAALEFIELDAPDPLGTYLSAAGIESGARVRSIADTPLGWCSWYYFFHRVKEADILGNLHAIEANQDALPLSLIQLDDGYEERVGDWFEWNDKFPHHAKWLADQILARRLRPGLWLAPFCAKPNAKIVKQQPAWILKQSNGRPAHAGFVYDSWWRVLDITHPGVQSHLHDLIHTAVHDWGFAYLKLDFLYAGALRGKPYDVHLTRAQALHRALELMRKAAGDNTFLLGCGCPLGSGVGIFDGMRISTDVAPHWVPHYWGTSFYFHAEPDLPATRSAIRNTITRAPMHHRWWLNDPDCLLVRDENTFLNVGEVTSLASVIALSGGMFLLSDDMTSLSPERRRLIQPLLPVIGKAARAVDWIDSPIPAKLVLPMSGAAGDWWVIGLFNWADRPRTMWLSLKDFGLNSNWAWHVLDFWNQKYQRVGPEDLNLGILAAHAGVLLAVRAVNENTAQWVGSDLHFTQGFEMKEWTAKEDTLEFILELGRVASGRIWLQLPGKPNGVEVDGFPTQVERVGYDLYKIPVEIKRVARVVARIEK